MTRTRTKATITCAATFVAALTIAHPLSAQQKISESRIQELIRLAAEQAGVQQPTSPASAQTPAGAVVPITLDESVRLALDRNLDIAVQRLNPELQDITIASAGAAYHPTLTSLFGPQSSTTLPTSQTNLGAGGTAPITDTLTYNAGVTQSIPWGGGSLTANFNNFRRTSTSNNVTYNPLLQSNWQFFYTQPLLRNFGMDSTRQTLAVSKINRDISDVQLKATIINTLSNVRNAYWDYVFATQAVDVAKQSLALADKLVQDNQTRVEVGTMAPIDVVQAQSEAATRRQALVQAESTKRTTELALKRLIVSGTQDPNWSATLDPVDRPDFRPESVDVGGAIRNALDARTDIAIARKNVEANNITLKLLQDQLKPQADLQLTYLTQGLAGTELVRTNTGVLGSPVTTQNSHAVTEAFNALFRGRYPIRTAQINFSYPLGLSAAKANVARARVQLNQIGAQMKQIELQVATDVTNAAISVQNNAQAVQAAQAARELSQKKLEAEQSKFEVGMSTNYQVVQAQRDLADAQNTELRNILSYRKALVELERLQQTTLSSAGITVLGGGGGGTTGTRTGG